MGGRVTASAIASASRLSFLFDLTYGFTNWGAISLTSWPWGRKRRAQSCAPPQASMPRRTGGSVAIQGIRSCRDTRLRYTTLPLSSLPTAGNTRLAISIPRTYISCFIGLASCGSRGSRIVNALGLIAVDPHRGGSISLRPDVLTFFGNRLPSLRKRVQPLQAIRSGEPRRNRLGKGLPANRSAALI